MQIWAEPEKAALPICNYSQILYQFLTFTQNLKRSLNIIRQCQDRPAGTTAKQWLAENDISEKNFHRLTKS